MQKCTQATGNIIISMLALHSKVIAHIEIKKEYIAQQFQGLPSDIF